MLGSPCHPLPAVFGRNRMPEALCQEAAFISKGGDLSNTPQVSTLFDLGKANKLNQTAQEGGGRLRAPAGSTLTPRRAAREFSLPLFLWSVCYPSHSRGFHHPVLGLCRRGCSPGCAHSSGAQPLHSVIVTCAAVRSNPDLGVPIPDTHRDQDPLCRTRL